MNKLSNEPEAEFNELEPRLKYGLFHLELHLMFQDLSRRSNKTGYWRIWDAAQIHKIRPRCYFHETASNYFLKKSETNVFWQVEKDHQLNWINFIAFKSYKNNLW